MNERQAPHARITPHESGAPSRLRSVAAIVCGVLLFDASATALFALSRVDPQVFPSPGFLVGSTLYGALFALLAGNLAARIARFKPIAHASGVAIIIGGTALVSMIAEWTRGSVWSQLSVLIVMAPAAVVGGILRERSTTIA